MESGTYIVVGDKYIDKPYDNTCSIKDFIEENYDKFKPITLTIERKKYDRNIQR